MPTSIVFTICSINYLAQAITLGNSLEVSNPEVDFRIYLVDKFKGREHIKDRIPFKVIEIENVPVTDFAGMCSRYNITELNTSVKPFIIDFIFSEEKVKNVLYFDPDIMVYENLRPLLEKLSQHSIILTPQILTPSNEHPHGVDEKSFLATGTFNLGFIALSRQTETFKFLEWWKARLIDQGFANASMQLFFDQKWINLAPIFFRNVYIEMSPGYNMAAWNLHERTITSKTDDTYIVNSEHALMFYHFSSVKASTDNISEHSLLSFKERPDLKKIIDTYRSCLYKNGNNFFSSFKCYYTQFYKGITQYYPKYHWITIYRRTRFNLGKFRRLLFNSNR